VDAIGEDTVVITGEGDRKEYNLPKSQVEGYDGAKVSLKIKNYFRGIRDIRFKLKISKLFFIISFSM
jgi:hypothetical protein